MAQACGEINKDDLDILYKETFFGKLQMNLWDIMENPDTNVAAKTVSMVSVSFVVISTCCMCLGTIQSLQVRREDGTLTDNIVIDILETLSVFWFTLEYLLRLLSCPAKLEFLRDSLNFLDVAAVLPFYVPLCISWLEDSQTGNTRDGCHLSSVICHLSSQHSKYLQLQINIYFANHFNILI